MYVNELTTSYCRIVLRQPTRIHQATYGPGSRWHFAWHRETRTWGCGYDPQQAMSCLAADMADAWQRVSVDGHGNEGVGLGRGLSHAVLKTELERVVERVEETG